MRIKKFIHFNENIDFNESLLDFCKNHLSYLVDNNIDIEVNNIDLNSFYHKDFTKEQSDKVAEISISDPNEWIYFHKIKDEFIQFLSILNQNYDIISVNIESVTRTSKYTVEEIFNDKDINGKNIVDLAATIAIYVKK